MAQKINFSALKDSFVTMLSNYNVALYTISDLRAEYKADKEVIENKLDNLKEARQKALDEGMAQDEAIKKYDILPLMQELAAREEKFKADVKPYNESIKALQKDIPDDLYIAYLVSVDKGTTESKGKVKVGKKVVELDLSFKGMVYDFLTKIGAGNTDNDTALNKYANELVVKVGGLRKSTKLENGYVQAKKKAEYKDLFIRAILQTLVIDKRVLTMAEDYTLSKTVYEG